MAIMLTRRELGLSAVAALGACAVAPESAPEPDVAEPLPAGPLYFDLHIDTPARLLNEGLDLAQDLEYTHVDIPKMRQGGLNAGFFAVSTSARGQTPLSAVKNALRITDVVIEEVARHPEDLVLATTSADVLQAQRDGKIAVLIGIEGGHMIDSSLEVLRQLYRLGARYMGLTHSGNTPWVGAAEYDDGPEGLTAFGREVVREMNRLGMLIDLSHASDQAFFDAVEASSAPILNTHAACRSVANHPRNLTDDMLRALGRNGGVLGVAYYAGMLDDEFRGRMSRPHVPTGRAEPPPGRRARHVRGRQAADVGGTLEDRDGGGGADRAGAAEPPDRPHRACGDRRFEPAWTTSASGATMTASGSRCPKDSNTSVVKTPTFDRGFRRDRHEAALLPGNRQSLRRRAPRPGVLVQGEDVGKIMGGNVLRVMQQTAWRRPRGSRCVLALYGPGFRTPTGFLRRQARS